MPLNPKLFLVQEKEIKTNIYPWILQSLPYWKGDGRNHVIIDTSLSVGDLNKTLIEQFELNKLSKAMVVSADYFLKNTPRLGFDILVPKFRQESLNIWTEYSMILKKKPKGNTYLPKVTDTNWIFWNDRHM